MTGIAAAIAWLIVPTLQRGYEYGIERHGGVAYINLKLLGSFKFDDMTGKLEDVPAVIRELDGKKVAIDGFMFGGWNGSDRLTKFQLVYELNKSQGVPKVQDRIFVSVPDRKGVEMKAEEVRAVGILHIRIVRDPEIGQIETLFSMELDHIEPL